MIVESVATAPQAAGASQDLAERLPLERFAFAQQLDRTPNELGRGSALPRRSLIQPGFVSLFQLYHRALHDITISYSVDDV